MSPKSALFVKKGDYKPQYFTLRTFKKPQDLSIQNVLIIWPNLRLGVLINFVLTTTKKVYMDLTCDTKTIYSIGTILATIFDYTLPAVVYWNTYSRRSWSGKNCSLWLTLFLIRQIKILWLFYININIYNTLLYLKRKVVMTVVIIYNHMHILRI